MKKNTEMKKVLRNALEDFAKKLNLTVKQLSPFQLTDCLNTLYKAKRAEFLTIEDQDYTDNFKEIFIKEVEIIENAKIAKEAEAKKQAEVSVSNALEQLKDVYPTEGEVKVEPIKKAVKKEKVIVLQEVKIKRSNIKAISKVKEAKVKAKEPVKTKPAPVDFAKMEKITADNIMEVLRSGINNINKFKEVILKAEESKMKIFNRRREEQVTEFTKFEKSKKTPDRFMFEAKLESGDLVTCKMDCFTNFYEVRK